MTPVHKILYWRRSVINPYRKTGRLLLSLNVPVHFAIICRNAKQTRLHRSLQFYLCAHLFLFLFLLVQQGGINWVGGNPWFWQVVKKPLMRSGINNDLDTIWFTLSQEFLNYTDSNWHHISFYQQQCKI